MLAMSEGSLFAPDSRFGTELWRAKASEVKALEFSLTATFLEERSGVVRLQQRGHSRLGRGCTMGKSRKGASTQTFLLSQWTAEAEDDQKYDKDGHLLPG